MAKIFILSVIVLQVIYKKTLSHLKVKLKHIMQLIYQRKKINLILFSIFIMHSSLALSLSNNFKQILNINSDNQFVDLKKNIAIFNDHVILSQKTIKIFANKVIVMRFSKNNKNIIVQAYGHPIKFYQVQNNGHIIKGYALKLYYELQKQIIKLTGNAFISGNNKTIHSECITYYLKKHKIQAHCNNKTNKVITKLYPSHI
ncbi:MAG: lipopolysaccharide transport periplasmic protein LptA [Pantoea sp. Brub]|nr:lipopolysaccharide transport periplasmic protein LptA [Pantoea sp. Brub]